MKKQLSLATISFVTLSALISIFALFGILELEGIALDLLFTFLTLTISGILIINCYPLLEKKKVLGTINLSLISLSSLLVILCYFTNIDNNTAYMNSTFVISVLSICFNFISSSILKMNKSHKIIQILAYTCYSILSLYLILFFIKTIKLEDTNLKIFILFIILSFVSMCILTILSKKQVSTLQNNIEYIKIPKKEYNDLLNCKIKLENLLKERNNND